MRIVKMNPKEKRSTLVLAQPSEGAIQHLFPAALQAVVVVLPRASSMESSVVNIKTAFKSGSQFRWV